MMALLIHYKDKQMGGVEKAIESLKIDIGPTINTMKAKNEEDKEELVGKICELTGYAENSEVFKFLGLSQ